MTTYQDRRGSVQIDGQTSSAMRIDNTLAMWPAASEVVFAFRYRCVSHLTANTDWLFRAGTTNTPPFGFRHRANQSTPDYVIYFDTTVAGGGRPSLNIGSLTVGTNYAIVVHWASAGLSQVDHPDSTAGDFAIAYVFDLSTRSPTPAIFTSSNANLGFATDIDTGIGWRSANGQTKYMVSDCALYYSTSGSSGFNKTQALAYGQYTKNTAIIGPSWKHLWNLHYYGTGVISGSPAGDEAFHLADQGTGDGISTRDLSPSNLPVWTQTNLTQSLGPGEDTVQVMAFDSVAGDNLGKAHEALSKHSTGMILLFDGDSFGRIDLSARYPQAFIESLLSNGFRIDSWTGYMRGSGVPVKTTVPSMSGVSTKWYCNAGQQGSYKTDVTTASFYGLPMGGIFEVAENGTPTLGSNNEIIKFTISNVFGDETWFDASDDLWIRVPIFIVDAADAAGKTQLEDTVRFVGDATTVDLDLTSSTAFRQFPQDGASWATIQAGTGGARVDLVPNAGTTDVHLGTGSTSYTCSVRLPNGLTAGKRILICSPTVYKVDGSGNRIYSQGGVHVMCRSDNSASWIDFHTSQASANASKKHTDDMIGRWIAICHDEPEAVLGEIMFLAHESQSQATVESNTAAWVTRNETIRTALNWAGNGLGILVSNFTHSVSTDSATNDRQHAIDYRNAYQAAAQADPAHLAHWSVFDATKGLWGAPTSDAYNTSTGFTLTGIGESEQAAADATVTGYSGGVSDWLETGLLHPDSQTALRGWMDSMVADILAAPISSPIQPRDRSNIRRSRNPIRV